MGVRSRRVDVARGARPGCHRPREEGGGEGLLGSAGATPCARWSMTLFSLSCPVLPNLRIVLCILEGHPRGVVARSDVTWHVPRCLCVPPHPTLSRSFVEQTVIARLARARSF